MSPDVTLPSPVQPAPIALGRQPALHGFIVRRLFAANPTSGIRTVIEACRAELVWSRADFTRLSRWHDSHVDMYDGPHPEQAHRLPHERMAATVLNAWNHAHCDTHRIRELVLTLKSQRKAANDLTQSNAYRNGWANAAGHTEHEIADLWGRRRKAWSVLVKAIEAYRGLRKEITEQEVA